MRLYKKFALRKGTRPCNSSTPSWLYQITNNLCVSWLRRQKRKLKSLDALTNIDSRYNSLTPEQILEQKESSECIVRAVSALPERSRQVFILYLEGFSYREIATSLDVPTSTVSGRLQTAKKQLKSSISEDVPFSAVPGPLRIAMEKLRKDGFTMEEILKKHPLRRHIYGISNKYEVRWESDNGKSLSPQEVVRDLFGEVISRRVYPDLFLENGARLHSEDSGFVQYATPECDDILQLIAHEKAGERILERLSLSAEAKANREGFKGRMAVSKLSDESSENYLLSKHVKPAQLRNRLIPFLVTRQIFAGAGAIILKSDSPYHISRRANQIKVDISTSARDGIVRIPDNPHADKERYQRLQALIGDANMSEWTSYLKIGATSLLIQMLEDDFIPNDFALHDPIMALQQIAVDIECAGKIELSSGKQLTAIEIQREYLRLAKSYFESSWRGVEDVLAKWEYALDCLENDPMQLDGEVDWVIKKRLLETYRDKRNLEWHSPEISAMDLGYHNIRRAEGLYYDLEEKGKVKRLLTDERVGTSIHEPPQTTRAKFRGNYVKLANEKKILCGVNWSYIQIYEPEQKLFSSADPLAPDYVEFYD